MTSLRSARAATGIALTIGCALTTMADAAPPPTTCSAEKILTRPYLQHLANGTTQIVSLCQTEAQWRTQAAAMCTQEQSTVGTFKVDASGCAKDYGKATYTCCKSAKPVPSKMPPTLAPPIVVAPRAAVDVTKFTAGKLGPPIARGGGTSPIFNKSLNKPGAPLRGYVDLHAHLMNHIGFGGKLLHGGTDPGVLMPSGSVYASGCGGDTRPTRVEDLLGTCYGTHGGHDFNNNGCGNDLRHLALGVFASMAHQHDSHDVQHPEGWPSFSRWPKWNDVQHQQMYIDWIRRAYDGGLRVMVALAGNSITFARILDGNSPNDDKSTANVQLDEMVAFAARNSSFIEIARSSADLRRIVGSEKLAMVLGVELDHIGNFGNYGTGPKTDPSEADVRTEIQRLYGKGVRYVFPVHSVDNSFGGAAMYEEMFSFANWLQTGNQLNAICADPSLKIGKKINADLSPLFSLLGLANINVQTTPTCTATFNYNGANVPVGYQNSRGLTGLGKVALDEIMRHGMIIDVDHGGERTVDDILSYTGGLSAGAFPLVSGHNGPRDGGAEASERSLNDAQYTTLASRTSIAGVGTGASAGTDAQDWMNTARRMATDLKIPIAFGSDANGMANLPAPPRNKNVAYTGTGAIPQLQTGTHKWDYNQEGVAHFGLFPDFLKNVENLGGQDVVDLMYMGAEAFALTWAKSESVGSRIPPVRTAAQWVTSLQTVLNRYKSCIVEPNWPRDTGVFCVDGSQCTLASRATALSILQSQANTGNPAGFDTKMRAAVLQDCMMDGPQHTSLGWHTKHVHCSTNCGGNSGFQGACFEGCKATTNPNNIASISADIASATH